jgi:hypothetical protein
MELDSYLSAKQKKRKKRRAFIYSVLALIAICLFLIGAGWFFFRSPFLRVQNIAVQGNSVVATGDIITLLQSSVLRGHGFWNWLAGIQNMMAWPSSLSQNDLAFMPQLAAVTISKDYWDHTVTANVTERKAFAIWCFEKGIGVGVATGTGIDAGVGAGIQGENCYWFDNQGILFGRAYDTEGSLMFAIHDYSQSGIGLGGTILPDQFVPNLISIVNAIPASGIDVKEIALKDINLQEIDITTYNGPDLYFSLRFPADNDVPVLKSLMAKSNFGKLQYVDFRIENRAYYK